MRLSRASSEAAQSVAVGSVESGRHKKKKDGLEKAASGNEGDENDGGGDGDRQGRNQGNEATDSRTFTLS